MICLPFYWRVSKRCICKGIQPSRRGQWEPAPGEHQSGLKPRPCGPRSAHLATVNDTYNRVVLLFPCLAYHQFWGFNLFFFFFLTKKKEKFSCKITALQCCVGFCHTTAWSAVSIRMLSLPASWAPLPSHLSRSSQSTGWASCAVNSSPLAICFTCVLCCLSCFWLAFEFMDCSPPGSSAHGILQARILEWVAISSSRWSSRPRDCSWVSCLAGRFFTTHHCMYVTMLLYRFLLPSPLNCVNKSILYICVSVPSLQIDSSVLFF